MLSVQPVLENAVADVQDLLEMSCNCPVGSDQAEAQVQINVMAPSYPRNATPIDWKKGRNYPYYELPDHQFAWRSQKRDDQVILTINSPSQQGLAHALYALLQEKLGFFFVHPRETVIPCLDRWPAESEHSFTGIPKFDKKGFHLHTQHPTELTEALHEPRTPDGQAMIREYILWLARNQQNFFEFCLLETVNLNTWIPYSRDFVEYAHDRGVLCSVDLSLHMIQQHAFKLV